MPEHDLVLDAVWCFGFLWFRSLLRVRFGLGRGLFGAKSDPARIILGVLSGIRVFLLVDFVFFLLYRIDFMLACWQLWQLYSLQDEDENFSLLSLLISVGFSLQAIAFGWTV